MGSVNCEGYGYNDIPENAVGYNQTGYRGEYYLLEPREVRQTLWTPNRLRYEVNVSGPSSLVVNQKLLSRMAPQQRQWRALLQKWTNRSTYSAGAKSNRAGVRAGAHPVSIRTHNRRASGVHPDLANRTANQCARTSRHESRSGLAKSG